MGIIQIWHVFQLGQIGQIDFSFHNCSFSKQKGLNNLHVGPPLNYKKQLLEF